MTDPTTPTGKRLADDDWNRADIYTAILAIEAEAAAAERERLRAIFDAEPNPVDGVKAVMADLLVYFGDGPTIKSGKGHKVEFPSEFGPDDNLYMVTSDD